PFIRQLPPPPLPTHIATRNFDLAVTLKAGASSGEAGGRELVFMSIDRSEFASLSDYLKSRELNVISPQVRGGWWVIGDG
ncbi:hypothetical protein EON64_05180, partial [archaeon]